MRQRDPGPGRDPGDGVRPAEAALDHEAEELSAAVLAASRLFVAISARALARTDDSLTLPQLRALVVLDTCGPVKLVVLATTLGVNPSTALRMVERLEALDLVDRRTNPANRREVVLSLTGAGRVLVGRVLAQRRAEIRRVARRLSARERAVLVPALRALARAAGETAVDTGGGAGADRGVMDDPLDPAAPPEP
ncbi:MarR family transcriptional regulator [Streptomyces sp. NPDC047017]|uniref:MarR family winged helix-turn-helix transcriptional regulator n=1 Tax=Streptomyces sp. NPDC047017 TaxID=3155024 RepID=UPI0033F021DB